MDPKELLKKAEKSLSAPTTRTPDIILRGVGYAIMAVAVILLDKQNKKIIKSL